MRKTPLDDKAASTFRVLGQTRRRAAMLADILNGADKPSGYPTTDTRRTNSGAQPRRIVKACAMDIALGYVLDQLEAGDVTAQDLLRQAALLAETHPAKAQAKRDQHNQVVEQNRRDALDLP